MPSQQLKNNGPQSVVICCPVQGKDIKAPEVQVLWRNSRLGRKAPLQSSPATARSVGLLGILPSEARKQRWLNGFFLPQVSLSSRETRRQELVSGWTKVIQKNTEIVVKREVKITPQTKSANPNVYFNPPTFSSFPKTQGSP